MKTYTFYPVASDNHHYIKLSNYNVYLNNRFVCSFAYSIIISHTIFGKRLCIYSLNGQEIFSTRFPNTQKKISYTICLSSIFIHSWYFLIYIIYTMKSCLHSLVIILVFLYIQHVNIMAISIFIIIIYAKNITIIRWILYIVVNSIT